MPLTPNAPVAIFDNIFLIWTDQVWFCLPLPQYRDPILRPFMCLSVNICDNPSIDPTVQI